MKAIKKRVQKTKHRKRIFKKFRLNKWWGYISGGVSTCSTNTQNSRKILGVGVGVLNIENKTVKPFKCFKMTTNN